MKSNKWACLFFWVCLTSAGIVAEGGEHTGKNILVTTFPIHQIVRNITAGAKNINLQLMIPANLGCPHDYALSPLDMQKIEEADIVIINGLGMEQFIKQALDKAATNISIIDSSHGIADLIAMNDDSINRDEHGENHLSHGHGEYNPHLFASPLMSAELTENIAKELERIDSANATVYTVNARIYAEKLRTLAKTMQSALEKLPNNRVIEPHGAFDYLARDIGLEIVATMQVEGASLSPAELFDLMEIVNRNNPAAIITEPQYPERTGTILSQETGLPVIRLDPVASGPENAALDYYETVMYQNMQTLVDILGK